MYAPITAPIFIQTVHGLTYKVVRTLKQGDSEDPQLSRKSNRAETEKKSSSSKQQDDSRYA